MALALTKAKVAVDFPGWPVLEEKARSDYEEWFVNEKPVQGKLPAHGRRDAGSGPDQQDLQVRFASQPGLVGQGGRVRPRSLQPRVEAPARGARRGSRGQVAA